MVIIITGSIGIGKTTVCEKVVKIVRSSGYSCGGILTHKAANERLIALDIQTGEKVILASTDNTFDGPRTPRYSFNPEAIKFGIGAINKAIDSDVLIIDELGHLELNGEGFAESLLAQLGDNPAIFETTISTRDRLPRKICSSLIGNLPDFPS
jgi:nucleoside-triphosphatase THEP1